MPLLSLIIAEGSDLADMADRLGVAGDIDRCTLALSSVVAISLTFGIHWNVDGSGY